MRGKRSEQVGLSDRKKSPAKKSRRKTGEPGGVSVPGKFVGSVRALRDGYGFVQSEGGESVSLGKQDMRRVFPGDLVEVKVSGEDRKGRLQGRIADVLERHTSELVGQFNSEQGFAFVTPSNSRISHDIHIPKKAAGDALHGQIVVVEITEPPGEFIPAHGRVKEVLGNELQAGMEIEIALRNFEIPHEWPEAVEDEADRFGSSVKARDKAHRLDLRELPFVTIDGEDARDFDDAVYAQKHKDGWLLRVAIADVSHYVKPNSPLDKEAQERGTSVYFPEYVVPMLPEVLSNGLCSLNPKVDRLALVCEIELDASGQVMDFRFAEAIIRSQARLTYTRVAKVLAESNEDKTPERKKLGKLCEQVDELYKLYRVLFAARQQRGAMEFESVEVRFEFNENRKIDKIVPVERNEAHRLIEECMLCANICAAEFLQKNKVPGLYRVHLPPANEKLAALRDYLTELGLWLGGGDQPSAADFKKLTEAMGDRPDKRLIQTMILRSQQQAVYQAENQGHFGLAYDAYAHFTSPIRRYPDLLVHRAIRSLIRSDREALHVYRVASAKVQKVQKNYPYDAEAIQGFGTSCSMTERRAEEATRDVVQWLKCEYLQKHLGDSFMGVVASVTHFGLFVQIIDLYIEGLIHIANLPHDYYEYDSIAQQLIGQSSRRTFKLGDKAMVQVARVDLDERKIDLVLTDSSESAESESGSSNSLGDRPVISRNERNRLARASRDGGKTTEQNFGGERGKKQSRRPGTKKTGTRHTKAGGKKKTRRGR